MTLSIARNSAPRRRRPSILAMMSHLYGVWRQRQVLKTLDEAALHDIGVTREQARNEARRRFWDAPHGWRI